MPPPSARICRGDQTAQNRRAWHRGFHLGADRWRFHHRPNRATCRQTPPVWRYPTPANRAGSGGWFRVSAGRVPMWPAPRAGRAAPRPRGFRGSALPAHVPGQWRFPCATGATAWLSSCSMCWGQHREYRTLLKRSADPAACGFSPAWRNRALCAGRRYRVFAPYPTSADGSAPAIPRFRNRPCSAPAAAPRGGRFVRQSPNGLRRGPCRYHAATARYKAPFG